MNEDTKSRAWKYVPALIIVLSVFLLVHTLGALKGFRYIGGGVLPQNVITVSGEGEVFAVPDIATVSFSVTQMEKDVQAAQKVVTDKTDAVIEKLESLGVAKKDIKTTDYNVYPRYDYQQEVCTQFRCPPGKQILLGYEVNHTITVKIRKVDDSGKVLGVLGESQVTNISGLSFTIDDEDALVREARQAAIDEAREKAEELAKDLDVRLVRIVSFSEGGQPMPYFSKAVALEAGGRGGADAAMPPTVPAGENRIVSNVSITYEIR